MDDSVGAPMPHGVQRLATVLENLIVHGFDFTGSVQDCDQPRNAVDDELVVGVGDRGSVSHASSLAVPQVGREVESRARPIRSELTRDYQSYRHATARR